VSRPRGPFNALALEFFNHKINSDEARKAADTSRVTTDRHFERVPWLIENFKGLPGNGKQISIDWHMKKGKRSLFKELLCYPYVIP